MIIFDLDGTLADCEHRRHFVDRDKNLDLRIYSEKDNIVHKVGDSTLFKWQPDWRSFYEACDKDTPINPVKEFFTNILYYPCNRHVEIWSGRCESVREKTIKWLLKEIFDDDEGVKYIDRMLKMRPMDDNTPDDKLKERWLDEAIVDGKTIDFVVDDRPKVVRMWRRRGIFVFDVNQTGKEF